jgi:WD40 repeat protein
MIQAFTIDQGVINLGPVAINALDKSEIICINYHANSNIFFCGHINGNISAWNISSEDKFLKCIANSKIHDDSINCITFKDNFIITCSSDFNLKVFNLDNNFENVLTKNFESVIKKEFIRNLKNLTFVILFI